MPRAVRFLVLTVLLTTPSINGQAPAAESRAPLFYKPVEVAQTKRELMIDIADALHTEPSAVDWRSPAEIVARNDVIDSPLRIAEETNQFNGQTVTLRNYSTPSTGKAWVTGPTLRFPASNGPRSLRLRLQNGLPCLKPPCKCVSQCSDIPETHEAHMLKGAPDPEIFNTTNLHTHGLQVSPKCPQDNVFLALQPGCNYTVQVDIPAGHHAGTFWYHAHLHGSTAIQLASGIAGLLIIEGELDQYLKDRRIAERSFVFQRISYGTNGKLEKFSDIGKQAGKSAKTSINGQIEPEFELRAGQVERWRLLDARIEDTLPLRLVDSDENFQDFHLIAEDGIGIGPKPRPLQVIELAPGYRSDVLVQFKKPGIYKLVKTSSTFQKGHINGSEVLASIVVKPERFDQEIPQNLPVAGIPAPIPDSEIRRPRTITFSVDDDGNYLIDGKSYPDVPPVRYQPKLGTAEEWTIKNDSDMDHPFHIHINPFQVTAIKLKDGDEIQLKPEELIWRDTFLIPQGGYFKMRTRFEKFDGVFVFHCHFLNHEDKGMMATVEITP